jgi:hypothetical protein
VPLKPYRGVVIHIKKAVTPILKRSNFFHNKVGARFFFVRLGGVTGVKSVQRYHYHRMIQSYAFFLRLHLSHLDLQTFIFICFVSSRWSTTDYITQVDGLDQTSWTRGRTRFCFAGHFGSTCACLSCFGVRESSECSKVGGLARPSYTVSRSFFFQITVSRS